MVSMQLLSQPVGARHAITPLEEQDEEMLSET